MVAGDGLAMDFRSAISHGHGNFASTASSFVFLGLIPYATSARKGGVPVFLL